MPKSVARYGPLIAALIDRSGVAAAAKVHSLGENDLLSVLLLGQLEKGFARSTKVLIVRQHVELILVAYR